MSLPDLSEGPIAHLYYWARTKPDALALVGWNRRFTWLELLAEVQYLALELREQELSGAVLLDLAPVSERIFVLACLHEGILVAGLPGRLDDQVLNGVGFKYFVSLKPGPEMLNLQEIRIPLPQKTPVADFNLQPYRFREDETFRIIFSSGSTGPSKPIKFSLPAMTSRVRVVTETYLSTRPFMSLVGFRSSLGNNAFLADLWLGLPHLIAGDVAHSLDTIREFEVKNLISSPIVLQAFIRSPGLTNVPSVEVIGVAGAHLNTQLAKRAGEAFQAKITNLYGSTEAGIFAQKNALDGDQYLAGSIHPEASVKILDSGGQELGIGQEGEICVKTSFQSSGYAGHPELFVNLFRNGWFYPGDRGYLDSLGNLYVRGRTDDLINYGGIKIDPQPIEEFALDNFLINDAACLLVTQEDGDAIYALVVEADGKIDALTMRNTIREAFGSAAPGIVKQVRRIPRNENGKIVRNASISIEHRDGRP